jgi:pSer/pThr/pTyr-binding forkhead associated (FHA) protein
MIQLKFGGEVYPIAAGETIIGSASDSAVVLEGEGVQPHHAVVQGAPPRAAAIRSAGAEAEVRVNGVRLGADPTPLLHGDKIEIGAHSILVIDPDRAGSTQLFDSGAFADLVPPRPARSSGGSTSGGRLVCLTDGREYNVGSQPLQFGRDASAAVVVSGNDVSRQHAEIRAEPEGYVLLDTSVNGTYVNGERIGKTHILTRADVIRIGNDEFRFYADSVVSPAVAQPPSEPASEKAAPMSPAAPLGPPSGAAQRLSDTMHGIPETVRQHVTPTSPEAAPLASLLFRTGELKGRRVPVRVPVINIGRGDYNDIVIADPSVSTAHAKLQRREAIWILADLGSTNGTFVEGEKVKGETPLSPGTILQFGDVAALFEPLDDNVPAGRVQRTRLMDRIDAENPSSLPNQPQPARPRPRRPIRMSTPRPKGPSAILVTALLVLLVILTYLLLT